ncbi:MAG TPA: M3 family oligoendopeptidase [Aliidongia sp.]|nr:M3 family oligoendopeptidase [Aliidongia sp.]
MMISRLALLVSAGLLAMQPLSARSANLPAGEVPADVWDLRPLYPDDAAWQAEKASLESDLGGLTALKGTLGRDAGSLLAALDRISSVRKRLDRLSAYAHLKADEDTRISDNQARAQLASALGNKFDEATSFLRPEIIAIGAERVNGFIAAEPGLAKHGHELRNILRMADHTLTPEGEALLAGAGDVLDQPGHIYSLLSNAEIPWPTVKIRGQDVRLDPEGYVAHRDDADRAVRQLVFETFWKEMNRYQKTLGATLAAHLNGTTFEAKARKYPNGLSYALGNTAVPETVYRTLVQETNAGLPTLHRYLAIRKRLLNLPDERYWDMYVPLAKSTKTYKLDEAEQLVLEAVKPLGEQYHTDLAAGFASHAMHSRVQPGKEAGAFMQGAAYDVHPYVLLSFSGNYESVSTVAHEWGHAMHTVLADRAQPFENSHYKIFTAEIPSTTNEMLLADHVIAASASRSAKIFALSQELELLRATYFRQAMLAEFELAAHEASERGDSVTGESLSKLYLDLLKRYYGDGQDGVKIDDLFAVEWAYIPHFYNDFYVYQYATSIAAAAYFADGIERGDTEFRDRYLDMLKAGYADDPYPVVKQAGLDMATPEPYRALVKRMDRLMDQLETVLATKG